MLFGSCVLPADRQPAGVTARCAARQPVRVIFPKIGCMAVASRTHSTSPAFTMNTVPTARARSFDTKSDYLSPRLLVCSAAQNVASPPLDKKRTHVLWAARRFGRRGQVELLECGYGWIDEQGVSATCYLNQDALRWIYGVHATRAEGRRAGDANAAIREAAAARRGRRRRRTTRNS